MEKTTAPPPTALVIFGITGDLAARKLLPALYHLAKHGLLPAPTRIIGVTRRQTTAPTLLAALKQQLERNGKTCDPNALKILENALQIVSMDLLSGKDYLRLRKRLDDIETEAGVCMHRLYYLAIPAQTYDPVVRQLGTAGLQQGCPHGTGTARLLIEKPFGYDLASAHELIGGLGEHFKEEQIYRIDHYLAKETVQNILAFRFQNPLFRRIWNSQAISHIMITAAEEIGIEGRTAFYEQTGALRDFVQSHLLQLLALTTMDQPKDLSSDEIHHQKLALLRAVTPIAPDKVAARAVRGQYAGYRTETGKEDTSVETFAALALEINSERWRGTPILLRTGKALAKQVVEISLIFSSHDSTTQDNVLTIRIQPSEGISLRLLAKKPGFAQETEPVQMDFCYDRAFTNASAQVDAYERVLVDAFRGDKTLFATSEEVLASWHILENVINEWAKNGHGLHSYQAGSWGPTAANTLAKQTGTAWLSDDMLICHPGVVAS